MVNGPGLARMHPGDMVVYYSPKVQVESTKILHAFTAIGEIADEELFQVEESPDFKPFRRTCGTQKPVKSESDR